MLVSLGSSLNDGFLVLSRGRDNSRVVPLSSCIVNDGLREEFSGRINNDLDNWLIIYNSMMKSLSSMIRSSDIRPVQLSGSSVRINGQTYTVFTRYIAQQMRVNINYTYVRVREVRNNRTQVQQVPRSQFVENVRQVGESIENAERVIRSGFQSSVQNLRSNNAKVQEKRIENRPELRWDLDYDDCNRLGSEDIEPSKRWDLDWD